MNWTTAFYQHIEIELSEVTYATYVLRPMTSQKILTNQISRRRLKIFDWQATPHVTLVMTGWRQVNHSRQQAFEDHLPPEWLDYTIEDKSEIEN